MSKIYIDIRARIAGKGLYVCLPYPEELESAKGSTDGQHEDLYQLRGCVELFRTVLDRALLSTLSKNKRKSEEALSWFKGDTKKNRNSFKTVCDLAFLDSDWVKEKSLEIYEEFRGKTYFRLED